MNTYSKEMINELFYDEQFLIDYNNYIYNNKNIIEFDKASLIVDGQHITSTGLINIFEKSWEVKTKFSELTGIRYKSSMVTPLPCWNTTDCLRVNRVIPSGP